MHHSIKDVSSYLDTTVRYWPAQAKYHQGSCPSQNSDYNYKCTLVRSEHVLYRTELSGFSSRSFRGRRLSTDSSLKSREKPTKRQTSQAHYAHS